MFRKWILAGLLLLVVGVCLSGCRIGKSIGDSTWLDYNGDFPEQVLACVSALPATIQTPSNDYPAAAEFSGIAVEAKKIDEVRSSYSIEGSLKLSFGSGVPDSRYLWRCQVAERLTILKVTDLSHELLD